MKRVHLFYVLPLLFCALLVGSCASVKNKKENQKEEVAAEGTSRFIVSFYSPGNGIDRKAKSQFDKFLKEYSTTLDFTTTRWGREGEIDYCFDLEELDTEKQAAFITEVKDLLAASKKVRFAENETCRNAR